MAKITSKLAASATAVFFGATGALASDTSFEEACEVAHDIKAQVQTDLRHEFSDGTMDMADVINNLQNGTIPEERVQEAGEALDWADAAIKISCDKTGPKI